MKKIIPLVLIVGVIISLSFLFVAIRNFENNVEAFEKSLALGEKKIAKMEAAIAALESTLAPKPKDVERAKRLTVHGLDGRKMEINFTPERGGLPAVFILHFWGTWCEACRDEFPSLIAFAKQYPDLQIAAVAWGDSPAEVQLFLKKLHYVQIGALMPLVGGDNFSTPEARAYDLGIFPTTLFINKQAEIVCRIEGSLDWQSVAVQKFVAAFEKGEKNLPPLP